MTPDPYSSALRRECHGGQPGYEERRPHRKGGLFAPEDLCRKNNHALCEQAGEKTEDRRGPAQPPESEGDRAGKQDVTEAELSRQRQRDDEKDRCGRETRAGSSNDRLYVSTGCC